jgi:methylenetetrahydrofolate dehydrogenase (NADP+)/methenyltetrahydrofolate cyclohydrolase
MAEIDGKVIAQRILDRARDRAVRLRVKPVLSVVLVGNNKASELYVHRKAQAAEYVGVTCYIHRVPDTITTPELVEQVRNLQVRSDALIVQLPLPKHIDHREVMDAVNVNKDADCLSATAIGRVMRGRAKILPPTASAIIQILKEKKVVLKGKHVVVVGQGDLVGKPVASLFMNEPVTLTVCSLGTKNLSQLTRTADVLIAGTGKPKLIKAGMIKKGAVVIDAGSGLYKGKITGDVDPAAYKAAKYVTPVPGGVGPVTVAQLLMNTVLLAE